MFLYIDKGKQKATKNQPLPRKNDEANKDDSGNFITYFVLFCIFVIGGYVLYHKRKRVSYYLTVIDCLYLFVLVVCLFSVFLNCVPCLLVLSVLLYCLFAYTLCIVVLLDCLFFV